jgi:anthranilate synthase component 1
VVEHECLIRQINPESCQNLTALHQLDNKRYPYLLESVAHGSSQGCFDIALAFPESSLTLDHNRVLTLPDDRQIKEGNFLEQLDRLWQKEATQVSVQNSSLPFTGGWFLFLAYELVSQIEHKLAAIPTNKVLPIAQAVRIPAAVIRDHRMGALYLIAEKGREELLEVMASDLKEVNSLTEPESTLGKQLEEDEPNNFLSAADRCRDYLHDGDVFQVNLSRECRGKLPSQRHYLDLYRQLREHNPAPFAGLATFGESVVCSSSPERLLRVQNNHVEMRPIAGTRPRSSDAELDKQLSEELLSSPKEQAEHVMLIDLIRNDLGRICQYDSIQVEEDRVLESYAHVHHIVSNIGGELLKGTTPGEVIRALFPGGTITGCPKVRCMEIIAELEQAPRGAYTGSMGYLNLTGDMDLNILIRTIVCERENYHFRTGAGIVFDSVAEHELKETRHKAKGLLRALEL